MVTFDHVSKTYADGTQALREITFTVPRGQFCVLLGASGAGKSTLLRAVNGLTALDGGHVHVGEWELNAQTRRQVRREVAMIHQQFNLVSRSRVEANVLAGAIASLPLWRVMLGIYPRALRQRAATLVAQVGLAEKHFSRRAERLSGGQQQRVGIARAFLLDPPLVLADEPVASLDPKISVEVLATLRAAAKERGTTILCSLHQVELARQFGDRIVGMRDGAVVFDGPPERLEAAAEQELYHGKEDAA